MKIKYANSLVSYSRNIATAKQLEVDFSIVTLSGHIWENIRYAVAKEEVCYFIFLLAVIMFTNLGGLYSLITWHF